MSIEPESLGGELNCKVDLSQEPGTLVPATKCKVKHKVSELASAVACADADGGDMPSSTCRSRSRSPGGAAGGKWHSYGPVPGRGQHGHAPGNVPPPLSAGGYWWGTYVPRPPVLPAGLGCLPRAAFRGNAQAIPPIHESPRRHYVPASTHGFGLSTCRWRPCTTSRR